MIIYLFGTYIRIQGIIIYSMMSASHIGVFFWIFHCTLRMQYQWFLWDSDATGSCNHLSSVDKLYVTSELCSSVFLFSFSSITSLYGYFIACIKKKIENIWILLIKYIYITVETLKAPYICTQQFLKNC